MTDYKGAVLVTGATGNIGSGAVEKFVNEGFKVYAADIKPKLPDRLKELDHFQYLHLDVTQEESIKNGLEHIAREYGSLNHLVTAHGGAPMFESQRAIWDFSKEQWDESITLNLTSHFLLTKYSVPLLEKGAKNQGEKSTITLISSVNAIQSFGLPVYSTAKSALAGFTMT